MLKRRREKQQQMEIVIMEQMVPEDHFLRKVDRAVDFSFIYDLCAPLYCAENGRPAIDPEILFRMLFVGYLYGIKSEARLEEEVNYNIAYKWFCGLDLTQKAPDATTISQNRRRFRDNNIAEQIFNEILRQCVEKGLVGGGILYTDSTHIKAKANKHKKKLVEVAVTPKAYLAELDAQVDQEREGLGKKPFEREDGEHRGGGSAKRMQSTTDPESGQQSREGKPNGFYYSEHRTVDSKRNVIVNVHVEPANINDVTALPEILDEIETRLGTLPRYMGLDAGYHNAGIAHLLERKGIQGVIGYRRHTHKGAHYGKYRFGYDAERDEYICPEKQRLTWKNTTREGYRQYCCESKVCKGCARRRECFGASMSRKVVERHVWQGALDRVIGFTKTHRGKRIYGWRKETIERSFAEAKENHGLRYARMLGIANMREQCFLTAAVQNIKRLVASLRRAFLYLIPCIYTQMQGFVNALGAPSPVYRRWGAAYPCEAGYTWPSTVEARTIRLGVAVWVWDCRLGFLMALKRNFPACAPISRTSISTTLRGGSQSAEKGWSSKVMMAISRGMRNPRRCTAATHPSARALLAQMMASGSGRRPRSWPAMRAPSSRVDSPSQI